MFWTPWLAALAPLALMLAALWPQARRAPLVFADWAFGVALLAFAVSVGSSVAVALYGVQATPTFGASGIGVSLYLDAVSATMFVLVSFVGVAVIRYSRNYLDGDPNHGRFLRQLCFTIASVQTLIIAGNLATLIIASIATSVSLNRLLLFYGDRRAAVLAARKKFVASRLADAALIGAGVCLYLVFGSLDYAVLFQGAARSAGGDPLVLGAALLIAIAALLKSAQLPFHGWLLEVMETPTPVSALLHAGIINAGGFLVIRFAELMALSTPAMHTLAIVGALTALFGSLVMLTQTSVKVSLAYSTIAQMGFMLLQCGLGAFGAALLHIVAHSLYKAHAFLSSGSIIDVLRASWSPSPGGAPHPARFGFALAFVLAGAVAVGAAFGATLADKPGVFTLGAILMMSLTLLVASGLDERPSAYVIGRTIAAAMGVGALYFALQVGVEHVLGDSVPATAPLTGAVDLALVGFVIVAFAGVTLLQSQLGRVAATGWGRALYVHLSQGLYLNTIANRLALRLWPARAST
ncbi:MAG: proton-conducting transporter membrane subunit [Hyphomonadaceae bacterium]|nr:proton-conducting transporter membrane subunit [Hyphomonadaceae bacterium]